MTCTPKGDWPPIISGADRSSWIVWRDIVITLFMWGLFLFLLEREIEIAWQGLQLLTGYSVESIDSGLEEFMVRMMPTVLFIMFLVAVLGVATLASRRRRDRAVVQTLPVAVLDWELASDLGIDEHSLHDIRQQKIVAIDVNSRGRVSVRTCRKISTGAPGG